MNISENTVRLDPRLAAAASFVRRGSAVADIGTDHAYLPIYLIQSGISRSAIACDINRGPLERAKADAAKYSMGSQLSFCLSDGLRGVDLEGITDIVICGMGGELIARIVGESEYTKKPGVRLILQPMTAADDLRAFLDEAGYAVIDEKLASAAGKIYCCICAEYDGAKRSSTPAELLLGRKNIANREPLFAPYADGIVKKLEKRISGLKKGGHDCSAEEACRDEIIRVIDDPCHGGNSMTIYELHERLTEKFPRELSCSWDNDGIMVSADTSAEVKKILIALDGTAGVIAYARENGYDTVLTHHPMLFRGVKSVTQGSLSGRRILEAALNGVSVISLHTRMDAGEDGVNDSLVRALGFEPSGTFGDDDAPSLGRVADIEPISGEELAKLVKEKLGCASVRVTGDMNRTVTRIGVCGGDGKDFVYPALASGCGAYITGDSGYNMAEDAAEDGLLTIEVGHYHSEAPVLASLAEIVGEITGIAPDIYDSCAYRVI